MVERVETGQGDELEPIAELAKSILELSDLLIVEASFPVERRRAVVRKHLAGEVFVQLSSKLAGQAEVRGARLDPDEVGVGRVRLRPSQHRP